VDLPHDTGELARLRHVVLQVFGVACAHNPNVVMAGEPQYSSNFPSVHSALNVSMRMCVPTS